MASNKHEKIETNIGLMLILIVVTISIGGLIQIIPLYFMHSTTEPVEGLEPYSALALSGRDVYVREGCYVCHSQMIRPFRAETERYGHYSLAGEFVYDRPFQWGSKRTGPDLHRVGGKYTDAWHWDHMYNPREPSPGSIMPAYPWLYDNKLDDSDLETKIEVMQTLGVPYPEGFAREAKADLDRQAQEIADRLAEQTGEESIKEMSDREIIALIAYLQRLGTDIKAKP